MKIGLPLLMLCLCTCLFDAEGQAVDEIVNALSTNQQKADTLHTLARRNMMYGRTDSAMKLILKGMPYAAATGNENNLVKYYHLKANIHFNANRYDLALQTLHEGRGYITDQTLPSLKAYYHMFYGSTYRRMNRFDSAMIHYRIAEEANNNSNSYRNYLVYLDIALMYRTADNWEEAERYYEKAYAITREKAIRMDHGVVLPQIAQFYFNYNKPDKYARLLKEHQEFVKAGTKNINKDPAHSYLLNDFGDASFENCVDFLKKVVAELEKRNDLISASVTYSQLSELYEKKNDYAQAIMYSKKSEEGAAKITDLSNQYIYTRSLFRLYKLSNQYDYAAIYADKMILLKDSMIRTQQRTVLTEMETKYQTEKKQKEIELLNTQKAIADKENEILSFENLLRNNQIFLLNADKKVAALRLQKEEEQRMALTRENELMDSILISEKAYSSVVNSEKQKEEALNASLNRENNLKVSELKKEKRIRLISTIGAALLLLSGIAIFGLYARQKKKNTIIQKQAADLEIVMQEIHHRVKNNLQIVSSLLDLQSHAISDTQAAEAVKEGKNRVQSMALIHQNLYSEGNIKGIQVKEYISNLLQSLCDSYNITSEKVKIHTDIDNLNLDVDTMIPLGLVLNELVSNSFKYAFKTQPNGKLNVVLKQQEQQLKLMVSDNGKGFPEDLDTKTGKSFGLKMIRAFAQKLKAQLHIHNRNGAVVEMLISKYKLA
jgi:two-component system, sensor histidine kinase PdtaS